MLEWAGRDEDVAAPFAFLEAMAVSDSEIESLLARVARDIDWTIPSRKQQDAHEDVSDVLAEYGSAGSRSA